MQVIGFKWQNFEPKLIFDNDKSLPLFNQKLSFRIGKRFCVGYFKNGVRHPCPERREVTHGYQCEICRRLDDSLPCVQCVGFCRNLKKRAECMRQTYYIYLATFGDILKVGISNEARLKQRLVEQGADFGVKLFKVVDGAVARREEQKIKRILGIVDRVRGDEKHKKLPSSEIGIEKIKTALEILKKYYSIKQEIFDLRKYYNLKPIKTQFITIEEGILIKGKVVSVKGNLILMENENISFNAHELIGRELTPNTSPKDTHVLSYTHK